MKIRETTIVVKEKAVRMISNGETIGIEFNGPNQVAILSLAISEISLTIWNGKTYLDTGINLFGPIDDAAAQQISQLIQPADAVYH